MVRRPIILTLAILAFALSAYGQVAGRYTDGRDYAVYFEQTRYGLTIRPVMWTATQLLKEVQKDKFVVVDRASRTADFARDATGRVTGVTIRGMDGEGLQLVRSSEPLLAVELLLRGRVRDAAAVYSRRGADGLEKALETAQNVLERLPTKTNLAVSFLNELVHRLSTDPKFYSLLGKGYVQAGDRMKALMSFRRAHSLDPRNEDAISGLFMLGELADAPKKDGGWKIPFPLAGVFKQPTAAEIKAVESDWAGRDLAPKDIREESRQTMNFAGRPFTVRVVSHLVHGSRHYGAIIVPQNARPGCCAVIVDAKGVSPNYFPLTVEDVESVATMADLAESFVYVVPAFRGEVMRIGDKTFTSEGDRRDALDGATDDALALLNVALQTTPEADAGRVCAFGRSRGGNVALLMGERDTRIKCVVDISGPTDWFYLMGTEGWTEQELWNEAVRIHANTAETGGQNLERFFGKAIDRKASLADVRHNMIASSPLYFAHRLPLTQMHHGLDDPSVPSRNGYELLRRIKRGGKAGLVEAHFYPDQGHDTDRLAEPEAARRFIARVLKVR